MLDKFRLDGRTALVTGCNRGIGLAMAVALAEAGADIVGVSASLSASGSLCEQEVRARGRQFTAYHCDFSDRASTHAFINTAAAQHRIDILVNNAGTIRRAPAVQHDDVIWDEVLETNLSAPFILAREFGRRMIDNGGGKIIFTASLLTFQGGINVPGYAASKSGIGRITMALANEWAGKNININAIAPGYVATDNTEALRDDPVRSNAILNRIPAGRWGTVDDFAGAVVFLASPASAYMNGHTIVVDGGWLGR
ncbi:SDR family oxidoreductase [Devosia salina]|uniref:SDR family oxidoreductase n=1 Tax=Devosia salina TaxID=2860336 RepID=A0ABX8WK44_9HYPH|nr:SDR family oxidoreductase [Devosia salina]